MYSLEYPMAKRTGTQNDGIGAYFLVGVFPVLSKDNGGGEDQITASDYRWRTPSRHCNSRICVLVSLVQD